MNFLIIGNMRTILFLTILCFSSCGTDQGSTETYTYTVLNESGVDIKIIGYVTFTNVEEYVITLKDNEKRTQIYKDGLPPRGYSWSFFYGSSNGNFAADSIKIIYNNTKYSDFSIKNIDNERNPLYKPTENKTEGFFTFTEEDYENAEPCNGSCE